MCMHVCGGVRACVRVVWCVLGKYWEGLTGSYNRCIKIYLNVPYRLGRCGVCVRVQAWCVCVCVFLG